MADQAGTTAFSMVRRALPKVLALVVGALLVKVGGGWSWAGLAFLAWVAMTPMPSWWRYVRTGENTRATADPELTEPGAWSVHLETTGPRRIEVIKQVRQATGAGLLDAKAITDELPSLVVSGLSEGSARRVHERLEHAGATAVLREDGAAPTARDRGN